LTGLLNNLPGGRPVVFAEVNSRAVIETARFLTKNSKADAVLLGSSVSAGSFASAKSMNLSGLKIRDPRHDKRLFGAAKKIFENSSQRKISLYEIQEKLKTPLWYGLQAVNNGQAEILVIGKGHTYPDINTAVEEVLGPGSEDNYFSTFYLVFSEERRHWMALADCGLEVRPAPEVSARIAADTARSFTKLTGLEARTAMLSFSTAGSAVHPMQEMVSTAAQIAKEKYPGLLVDGEMQFDSAVEPKVAAKKMPDSQIAGKANVLIFPSSNAGNIGLQLAKHTAGYKTLGPFIQGFSRSVIFLPDTQCPEENKRLADAGLNL